MSKNEGGDAMVNFMKKVPIINVSSQINHYRDTGW